MTINNFRLSAHLYSDNSVQKCVAYCSKETGIPEGQFGKTQVDKRKNTSMAKRGKLGYGTAHLTVVSNGRKKFESMALLRRRINAQMDEVFDQAGLV